MKEDKTIYRAVINEEEYYSIWPAERAIPPGWSDAGKVGAKDDVLAWIDKQNNERRPISQRR